MGLSEEELKDEGEREEEKEGLEKFTEMEEEWKRAKERTKMSGI